MCDDPGVQPLRAWFVILPALLLVAAPARGERREGAGGPSPSKNASTVADKEPWILTRFEQADRAIDDGDWGEAVRTLQEVVDLQADLFHPNAAPPYVVSVSGAQVFEGAWLVAHQRLLAGGAEARAAYEEAFGRVAREALDLAVVTRDEAGLQTVVRRFLPLEPGRRAALLLADLALEQGDGDAAMGWLDRLALVDEVAVEPEDSLAAWRDARIARTISALSTAPPTDEALRAALADPELRDPLDAIPPELRRGRKPVTSWPTAGGDASRTAVPPGVGADLELAWTWQIAHPTFPELRMWSDQLPSPWIAARAVVDDDVAFVNNGAQLVAIDMAGREIDATDLATFGRRTRSLRPVHAEGDRAELGLIEGHGVTLGPRVWSGRLVYAAVADPSKDWDYEERRDDHLRAFLFDGHRLRPLWQVGGQNEGVGLDARLYGSPLLYRGRLWIAGVRPTQGSSSHAETWLFGLDPRTGRLEVQTHLGTGSPIRDGRGDEAIPSSPAGARGRVVVVTGTGIVAAVDAGNGATQWAFRYDRDSVDGGQLRRLRTTTSRSPRSSGFVNEPPLLAEGRCHVTPTDSCTEYVLLSRPQGPGRSLVSAAAKRDEIVTFHIVEQLVGIRPAGDGLGPTLVVAGQGQPPPGDLPAPMVAGVDALYFENDQRRIWGSMSPTGFGAETYGKGLLTETEVFVPTRHGIAVYDPVSGADLGLLDASTLGPDRPLPEGTLPYGALIPVPGKGILAVNGTMVAYWARR